MQFLTNIMIIYIMSLLKFLKFYGNLVCNDLKMSTVAAVYQITSFLRSIKIWTIFQKQNNNYYAFYTIYIVYYDDV